MTATNVTPTEARDGLVYAAGYIWPGNTITYSVPGSGAVWQGYGVRLRAHPYRVRDFGCDQAAPLIAAAEVWDSYIAPSMNAGLGYDSRSNPHRLHEALVRRARIQSAFPGKPGASGRR